MTPRRPSELFRLGVGLVAAGILAATAGRLAEGRSDWWLVASLAVAGTLALAFPLQINLSTKMSGLLRRGHPSPGVAGGRARGAAAGG